MRGNPASAGWWPPKTVARTVQTSEAPVSGGRDRLVLDLYRDLARTQVKDKGARGTWPTGVDGDVQGEDERVGAEFAGGVLISAAAQVARAHRSAASPEPLSPRPPGSAPSATECRNTIAGRSAMANPPCRPICAPALYWITCRVTCACSLTSASRVSWAAITSRVPTGRCRTPCSDVLPCLNVSLVGQKPYPWNEVGCSIWARRPWTTASVRAGGPTKNAGLRCG
jgi:hypothetical protein